MFSLKQKKSIMWLGVGASFILILFFWSLFSYQNVNQISNQAKNLKQNENLKNLNNNVKEITTNFQESLSSVKKELENNTKNMEAKEEIMAETIVEAEKKIEEEIVAEEIVEDFKKNLIKKIEK